MAKYVRSQSPWGPAQNSLKPLSFPVNSSFPPLQLFQSQGIVPPTTHSSNQILGSCLLFCPLHRTHALSLIFNTGKIGCPSPSSLRFPSSATTIFHMNYCNSFLSGVLPSGLATLSILHTEAQRFFVKH